MTLPVAVVRDEICQKNWDAIKALLPNTGDLKMGAYANPDPGWLLCDGTAVSRTTYKALFDKIGTTYGAGDGSTTFNLPDFRGRAPAGSGTGDASGATAHTLGAKVGKETHLLTSGESGVPAHNHSVTDPGHGHRIAVTYPTIADGRQIPLGQSGTTYATANGGVNHIENSTTGITINNNTAANAASAHENRTPSTVINFFIKT